MPAQTPGIGYVADSEVGLLRKIVNNTAITAAGGGGSGTPGGADGDLQVNSSGAFGGITPGAEGEVLKVVGGAWASAAGGGGAVDSVNGQTGVVVLDATDVGAVSSVNGETGVVSLSAADVGAPGLSTANSLTALNTLTLLPNTPWTSKATGSSTATLNTQYYITTFTANTTITGYDSSPVEDSKVTYLLRGCNGTSSFTFPAAQRLGTTTGTSTTFVPTAGVNLVMFTYINGAWVYGVVSSPTAGSGIPGGSNGDLQVNTLGEFAGITPGAEDDVLKVVGGVWTSAAGGGGAVDSVNGQTGTVNLNASDVGAADVGDVNTFTALQTFNLIPNVPWTSKATGSSTSALNTQYYIDGFTANTTITAYDTAPVSGSKVAYKLIGCNGTATFTFPAAQRAGDPTGTSTVITPSAGEHNVVFTYVNAAWSYQDDLVNNGINITGTFTSPNTSNPLALTVGDCYNRVLFYGATGEIDLPAMVSGMNITIYNTGAFTITIDPNGSEVIVRDGTAQTGGVSITLSTGAGNFVCLVANGTQWVTLGFKGSLAQGS